MKDKNNMFCKMCKLGSLIIIVAMLSVFSLVYAAESKSSDSDLDELAYGEVKSVLELDGDLLLILVELPLTFRITDSTKFVSNDHRIYTKNTAKTMLIGKGVRIKQHTGPQNEIIADEITVVSDEELAGFKKEQPERTGAMRLPQKDSVR